MRFLQLAYVALFVGGLAGCSSFEANSLRAQRAIPRIDTEKTPIGHYAVGGLAILPFEIRFDEETHRLGDVIRSAEIEDHLSVDQPMDHWMVRLTRGQDRFYIPLRVGSFSPARFIGIIHGDQIEFIKWRDTNLSSKISQTFELEQSVSRLETNVVPNALRNFVENRLQAAENEPEESARRQELVETARHFQAMLIALEAGQKPTHDQVQCAVLLLADDEDAAGIALKSALNQLRQLRFPANEDSGEPVRVKIGGLVSPKGEFEGTDLRISRPTPANNGMSGSVDSRQSDIVILTRVEDDGARSFRSHFLVPLNLSGQGWEIPSEAIDEYVEMRSAILSTGDVLTYYRLNAWPVVLRGILEHRESTQRLLESFLETQAPPQNPANFMSILRRFQIIN